jgi:membrane fusion protein (multidrug efflux system)
MLNQLPRAFSVPILLAALVLGLLRGCHRSGSTAAATSPAPAPSVQVVTPQKGEISRSITLPTYRLLAYQEATLYAKVPGYLKTITVDKGDPVKEGQLLAEIEVPEMLADRVKYEAEVEVAATDYQRVTDAQTKAPDLVTPQAVNAAKGKYLVAKANLERLETLLSYAKILAPFSGVVTRRSVDPGAFIPAATSSSAAQSAAVLTLMDFSSVRVQVAVPEPECPFIKNGLPVQVTVSELPGHTFNGKVTRYAHALDEATKTMLTEIEIPNPEGELLPGMYAIVKITVQRKSEALLLPAESLVLEKTTASIFVVADGKARKVPVKTGFNDGISAEILEGLNPADRVVLVGKQTLADGQAVRVVEAK